MKRLVVLILLVGSLLSPKALHRAQAMEKISTCWFLNKRTQKQQLKKLARKKARIARRNKAKAIRMAKKRGWPIRKVSADGTVLELMGLDPSGRPIYQITHEKKKK